MKQRRRFTAFRRLTLALACGLSSLTSAAEPLAETSDRLGTLATELIPATEIAKLAQQQWFPGTSGCRFRLADPPSGFTQFFVSTTAEGLSELECPDYRTIGLFKKGQLLGPAARLDRSNGVVVAGQSWPGGVLSGAGVALFPSGRRIEGDLISGKFDGPVIVRYPNGEYEKGAMIDNRYAPGEFRRYNAANQLIQRSTIGLDGQPTAIQEYVDEALRLEAPLGPDGKQGFGYVYEPGSHSEQQRRTTLWDKNTIKYQSPTLAAIMVSPCPPLLTAMGAFRPMPESCSEAVVAARLAAEVAMTPPPPPPPALTDPLLPAPLALGSPPPSLPEAPPPPPPVLVIQEFPFAAYSEDGRHYVRGITRNGELIPDEIGFDGGARRYKSKSMDAQLNGVARYFQNEELIFDGHILEGQFDGDGLCRFNGSLERCEYAYGERVDQLFKTRLELQAYKSAKQQEQERIARDHQEQLAAERQRAARAQAAQQASQPSSSGFQWGKLAALSTGALLGGMTKLPSDMQANIITGMVSDSMAGQEGVSGMQGAVQSHSAAVPGASIAGAPPAKPAKQSMTYTATCPGTGSVINIPISYRTQACLLAAQEFALAYSCNDADSFARVTQGCATACGSSQCAEP